MSSESRFQISVPDDALALLQRKLADVRFPDELSDVGWDYGAPLSDVKRLVTNGKTATTGARMNANSINFQCSPGISKWKGLGS
jgi:hypothetical protein